VFADLRFWAQWRFKTFGSGLAGVDVALDGAPHVLHQVGLA
jgi:hypothetical protein